MSKLLINEKDIVVPGEALAEGMDYLPGSGTYRLDDKIIAKKLGLVNISGRAIKLVALSGRYLPKYGDKIIVTQPKGWAVVPCPKKLTEDLLTKPAKGSNDMVSLVDLGGFDSAPWEPLPAQFAGTGARWIWPEKATPAQNKAGWLFFYRFDVPP